MKSPSLPMKSPSLPTLHESVFSAGLAPAPTADAVLFAYQDAQERDLGNPAIRDSWMTVCPEYRTQLNDLYDDLTSRPQDDLTSRHETERNDNAAQ